MFLFFQTPSNAVGSIDQDSCIELTKEYGKNPWFACSNEVHNRFISAGVYDRCLDQPDHAFTDKQQYLDCLDASGLNAAHAVCNDAEENRRRELAECTSAFGQVYQRTGNPVLDRQYLAMCESGYASSCVVDSGYYHEQTCTRTAYSCSLYLGDIVKEKPTCTDSDGTDVYGFGTSDDISGYIQTQNGTFHDRCLGGRTLVEYACDDNRAVGIPIDCVDELFAGCFEGACVYDATSGFDSKTVSLDLERNTFEDIKSEETDDGEEEDPSEQKKSYPIITGINVGEFDEQGNSEVNLFVYNGGEAAGRFSATLLDCHPFLQVPGQEQFISENQTGLLTMDVYFGALSNGQTKVCQVLVEDLDDKEIFTVADITFQFNREDERILCESDEMCELHEVCKTEVGLCVSKNLCEPVVQNGPVEKNLDIVFVGDGYDSSDSLQLDIEHMLDNSGNGLLNTAPFSEFTADINIWMVRAPEEFDGAPDEDKSDFYGADCAFRDQTVMISRKSFRPYAYLSGAMSFLSLSYYGNDRSNWGPLLLHEIGHAFGGLLDEYTEASVGDRHGEPNCASTKQEADWWWGHIPGTGAFEGCSYSQDNFRPTQTSIMREVGNEVQYGPVNKLRLEERLEQFR